MTRVLGSLRRLRRIPTDVAERLRRYEETGDERWIEPLYVRAEDHNSKVELCRELLAVLEREAARWRRA